MNKTFTKEALAGYVYNLKEAAKNDEPSSVFWFTPTKESPVSIIGGWVDVTPGYEDLFCVSKSRPGKAMSIDVVDNEDILIIEEEAEHTQIILEWDDDPAAVAEFFMGEWERLMEKYN